LGDQIGGKITFKGNNNSLKVQKNYFCNGTPILKGNIDTRFHCLCCPYFFLDYSAICF